MKKTIRILTTILVLCLLTTVYCVVAAPAIEPDSKYQKEELPRNNINMSPQQIMALFNPKDWEINSSRHLNYNNIHIFSGDYKFLTPESINFDKCTIVIINSEVPLKAIMIQCLGEITLYFEKPVLHGLDNNRILGGKLTGKIQVVSKGDEDNFSFKTQDFNIDKDRIWTNANVEFKYGRTQGFGSGMQIQLINSGLLESTQEDDYEEEFSEEELESSPISIKIENITIQKLHRLTIIPPVKKDENGSNDALSLFNAPIELRCDGPFVFNALSKEASFEQNVSLIQTVSNRASNSIRCQSLSLYFSPANRGENDQETENDQQAEDNQQAENDQEAEDSTQNSDSQIGFSEWDLQLDRLEAVGPLVVIEAPEYHTKIHTGRLTVNLSPLSFELDSTNRQSEIHYKNHLISAQNLIYFVGENGSLGTLECNCPGWISSQLEQGGKQIRIRWADRLRLEPDHNDPAESIVSIQGSARLEMEDKNKADASITADDIFFWLTRTSESSQSNGFDKLSLSRMQAKDNVVMKSKPITAKVKTLQLWFEQLDGAEAFPNAESEMRNTELSSNSDLRNSEFQIPDSELNNSCSITGGLLQGKILLGQGQPQISKLTLKDGVRLIQNNASSNDKNGASGLEMSGSQIQIFNLTLPSATASLIGQPAKIQYNNLTFSGTAINVNRGINRIWIDTGGEVIFLGNLEQGIEVNAQGNLNSAPYPLLPSSNSAASEPARIRWSKTMVFQDDTLTFTGNVSLQRKDQYAQCDALSIILNKKIDFQNPDSKDLQNSLDIQSIELNDAVKLENLTSENGITVAMDCLTASKLTIDMKKQTFAAEGPGRAMTQRKMKSEAGDGAKQDSGENSESNNPQLVNLSVDFQKRLVGSFDPRTLQTFTFSGYIVAVYSPISTIGKPIQTFNISNLPPQAFTLKCYQMEIQADLRNKETSFNDALHNSEFTSGAFIASGGVTLDGRVYNAAADKLTFEAKTGIITLEGDGQIPAQLFYQKVPGGRYNQAASSAIYYNTQTGAVKGEGIQDFSLFLSPKQQNGDNSPYN